MIARHCCFVRRIAFVAIIGTTMSGCGKSLQPSSPALDGLVLTPESENQERAGLLPTTPSEDARKILGELPIRTVEKPVPDEEKEFLPDLTVNWVVDIQWEGTPSIDPNKIGEIFDRGWRQNYGRFTDYGRDVRSGRWTYLFSSDGPREVDQLKMGFDFFDPLDEDAPLPSEQLFEERLQLIREQMQRLGMATVTASLPPAEAHQRARVLQALKRDADLYATLVLRAPRGKQFDGKAVWDVMLCLGLEWGDVDCFHWKNPSGQGDDHFFSVETTTPPGYFLPEEILAGRVQVEDLVFVFSVPRCAKPVEVLDAMHRAADYCQTRLGGTVTVGPDGAGDLPQLRQKVIDVLKKLKAAGFEPGADATLQLL